MIVAMGGSAGSLKPLIEFFDHTPLDSASYVIVQHLPKHYQSQLKSILDRHSKLQVVEVNDDMPILVNTVYIAPSNKHLIFNKGNLKLVERSSGPNRAIDLFFQSLTEDEVCSNVVGVLFSGMGCDGTKGAEAIKKAGGLVIVQSPESCQHGDMPQNAIQSGVIDLVKLPAEMPPAIQTYIQTKKIEGKDS